MDTNGTMKMVYAVVDRAPGKTFWTKVGVGFVNKDGSINLRLDAIPIAGTLQVRDYEPREWERSGAPAGNGFGRSNGAQTDFVVGSQAIG